MNNLKKLFSFSATERYGIAILSFAVVALILFNAFQTSNINGVKSVDFTKIEQESEQFYTSGVDDTKATQVVRSQAKNNLSSYSEKQKGNQQKNSVQAVVINNFVIEINSASVQEFQQIKGIGEKLSDRIVKFRIKLGGFHSINQLKDVYGVEPSLIDENRHHFSIKTSSVIQKSINQSEFKELLKHPYLDYEAVKCIFGFKNKSDSVSVNQALSCVSDSLKPKLKPYLKF